MAAAGKACLALCAPFADRLRIQPFPAQDRADRAWLTGLVDFRQDM
jgi:hypothetical protein